MGRSVTRMTIHDVFHYDEEARNRLISGYPKHVRRARAMGLPAIGEGAVFPIDDENIAVPGFDIPPHWLEIAGLDFGWDHPTASARLAYDPDEKITYVTQTYRKREETALYHASKLKGWGSHLPFAWGAEGHQRKNLDNPEKQKDTYRRHGLKMLDTHATFDTGGVGVEQGCGLILEEMQSGRFKVFSHLEEFFEEKNSYHREKNDDDAVAQIKKVMDDILDATRYARMMLRYAVPVRWREKWGGMPKRGGGGRRQDSRDIFDD